MHVGVRQSSEPCILLLYYYYYYYYCYVLIMLSLCAYILSWDYPGFLPILNSFSLLLAIW